MDSKWLKNRIIAARDKMPSFVLKNANVVNVFTNEIQYCDVALFENTIIGLGQYHCENTYDCKGAYLCPGFIDTHMHVESTMLVPWEFAKVAMPFGTTFAIADPHEIANVLGLAGVRFMNRASEHAGMGIYYMCPSSVPSVSFEQNNAIFREKETSQLIWEGTVYGMGELMDYSSVLNTDEDTLSRLMLFEGRNIDGHAPGLTGSHLNAYRIAGASTDHECVTFEEILEKLRVGMRIQLRVGSAAHNINSLLKKIAKSGLPWDRFVFCTDDKSIHSILKTGHINHNARMAVKAGIPAVEAVKMASIYAANAYRLYGKGALAPGFDADMVLFEDLVDFQPIDVFVSGKNIRDIEVQPIDKREMLSGNSVNFAPLHKQHFALPVSQPMPVMEMPLGQLSTKLSYEQVPQKDGHFIAQGHYAKIAVVERHKSTGNVGVGIVKNFGLTSGALASTVSHDSHNMVIIGTNDEDMLLAAQHLKEIAGGYVLVVDGQVRAQVSLPIAGLLSAEPYKVLVKKQRAFLKELSRLGLSQRSDPLTRLSFFALPVLPEVRITTYGMYDVVHEKFLNDTAHPQ